MNNEHIPTTTVHNSVPIEIELRTLNIDANLDDLQRKTLIQILQKYKKDFSWEYSNMRGINPQLCTHHIYIEKYARAIHQHKKNIESTPYGYSKTRISETL